MIWLPLLLLGLGATVAVFWDELRDLVLSLARGWVRETLGPRAERWLIEAVVRLDLVMSRFGRFVRRTIFARVEGRRRARVTVEEIPLDEMPDEILEDLKEGNLEHAYSM